MRHFYILFLLFLLIVDAHAQSPKSEIRAVWLTTIGGLDWPHSYNEKEQKAELCHILDRLQKVGINTVLLQTRIRATTIYPSALEPWDGCLSGTPGKAPRYDALQLAIDECHKRGMQLHAWVVTIPIGKWNQLGCMQLRKKHPKLVKRIGEEGYLNPENPETANYLAQCCHEIVKNYDVDGIHLDYIRYPETWPKADRRGRNSRNASTPSQRRACITSIVRAIGKAVKSEKPWVMLSCSPIGKHDDLSRYRSGGWNARSAVSQDAQAWLRLGLMDALFPMMYFRDNQFFPFAIDWQEQAAGRFVVPGLGIYFLDPKEGRWTLDIISRQMNVVRQLGMGHCFFRYKFLNDNKKGIYDFTQYFNATPALIPAMSWLSSAAPTPPQHISLSQGMLCWSGARDNSSGSYLLYNIYASEDFPVDITNAANLVRSRLQANQLQVPTDGRMNYAVTAQDRFGQESPQAAQLLVNAGQSLRVKNRIARTNGTTITLPAKPSTLDAPFVIVETLQGRPVTTFAYDDKPKDISALPEGIYQLRSLGKKGRTHRIGFFTIKRKKEPATTTL